MKMERRDSLTGENRFTSVFCLMDSIAKKYGRPNDITYRGAVKLPHIAVYETYSIGDVRLNRTRRHILADPNRDFILSIPLTYQVALSQGGRETICNPDAFRLLSSSLPFSSHMLPPQFDSYRCGISARVSGTMLRQYIPEIDSCPNLVLQIRHGAGRAMRSMLELALSEGRELSTPLAEDFSRTLVHVIADAVLSAPEFEGKLKRARQPSRERIYQMARDFIGRNLSNPLLDCTMVASHCQVSNTYLHSVFASFSSKVAAYIRELRLQQCHAVFVNPELRDRTITEIILNWGFDDLASFSQIYKTRFGRSPREMRKSALLGDIPGVT